MLLTTSIRKFYCLPLILTLAFTGLLSGCGSSSSGSSDDDTPAPAALELDTNKIWFDFATGATGDRSKTVTLTTNRSSDTSFSITDDGDTPFIISALPQLSYDTPAEVEVTVTADTSLKAGESLEEILTFSADGFANTTLSVNISADIHEIWVSDSRDRSNPRRLEGATLSGNAYIFVAPNDDIDSATFYYDDELKANPPYQIELAIWYDFERTIESDPALPANPFDTTNVANAGGNGPHNITVEIINDGGVTKELSSDFTISN